MSITPVHVGLIVAARLSAHMRNDCLGELEPYLVLSGGYCTGNWPKKTRVLPVTAGLALYRSQVDE